MKTILALLTVLLVGCGSEKSTIIQSPAPTPAPTVAPVAQLSPSPTPIVTGCDTSFVVGNWIDLKSNNLKLNSDCSAQSNGQKFTFAINDNNEIVFSANKLEIDTCAYEIISTGGLTESLKVTLDLICQKSGQLSYSKNN